MCNHSLFDDRSVLISCFMSGKMIILQDKLGTVCSSAHVVVCYLQSTYYRDRQFITVYIKFLNKVAIYECEICLQSRTNVTILYGTYFMVRLYNIKFDISAKTLKIVCINFC